MYRRVRRGGEIGQISSQIMVGTIGMSVSCLHTKENTFGYLEEKQLGILANLGRFVGCQLSHQ